MVSRTGVRESKNRFSCKIACKNLFNLINFFVQKIDIFRKSKKINNTTRQLVLVGVSVCTSYDLGAVAMVAVWSKLQRCTQMKGCQITRTADAPLRMRVDSLHLASFVTRKRGHSRSNLSRVLHAYRIMYTPPGGLPRSLETCSETMSHPFDSRKPCGSQIIPPMYHPTGSASVLHFS